MQVLDTGCSASVEQNPAGVCAGYDSQIGSLHRRLQKPLGRTPAQPLVGGLLEIANAFLSLTVIVIVQRNLALGCSGDKVIGNRSAQAQVRHLERAIGTVKVVFAARLIL